MSEPDDDLPFVADVRCSECGRYAKVERLHVQVFMGEVESLLGVIATCKKHGTHEVQPGQVWWPGEFDA